MSGWTPSDPHGGIFRSLRAAEKQAKQIAAVHPDQETKVSQISYMKPTFIVLVRPKQ